MGKSILDYELFGKIANKYCCFHCSYFRPWNMYREKLPHWADLCRLVSLLSLLWSMLWDIGKYNLLILKRLHKSEQRRDDILKEWFFVQFRVFYNKEFTRQKKVTNKLFISVWCVIITRRAGGVWSANRVRLCGFCV